MDSGYYAAMTGLVARTQALDTAAANLANAQTPGYRAEREYFRSVLLGPDAADSQLGATVNNYGLLGGDQLSMAQGALEPTGNPLDLAIEGQGFFMVQTANGLRYTRDGSFHRSQSGQLVTAGGRAGALGGRPADSDSAGRGLGGRRRRAFGGRRRGRTVGVFTFPAGPNSRRKAPTATLRRRESRPAAAKDAAVHQGAIEAANQDVIRDRWT